jgi:hypothetical protein
LFLWEVAYGEIEAFGTAGRGGREKGFFS